MKNDRISVKEDARIARVCPRDLTLKEWAELPVQAVLKKFATEASFKADRPFDTRRWGYTSLEAGLITNDGGDLAWKLICGAGGTPYDNADCRLGVGDNSTAANATQTDLLGTNFRKSLDASFPLFNGDPGGPGARQVLFQATFASSEANFAWEEFGIFNSAAGPTMLDRFVSSQGTKASPQVWQLQITVTLS